MPKLHIANTFFEWELETQPKMSLNEAFAQHAIFRQLQFLPLLYASDEDAVLLCDLPPPNYWDSLKAKGIGNSRYFTLDDGKFSTDLEIESWGPSQLIAKWAEQQGLYYEIPDWKLIQHINSKHFSFEHSPKLPNAALLSTESQARQWLDSFKGTKVLKTCYGVSGKGHLIIESDAYPQDRITSFLVKEWAKDLPVIAEPWVTRILDFSTQWSIDKHRQITYLGSTICNNDERGQYRFNLVGDEQILFTSHLSALKEHKKIVEQLMQKIALMGFFGNVGVDAMLYSQSDNPDRIYLHPVVEINARKTMGWAALQIQHRYFPNQTIRFQYATGNEGYLPDFVESKQGKKIRFSRNLTIEQMLFTI